MDVRTTERPPGAVGRNRSFVLFSEIDEDEAVKSWLVHNLLGCGEMSAFYGAPGCGKGVLIEDMALHIAAGWEWHGRAVTRGAVLYVALERKQLVKRRALAFRKKHGLRDLPFAIDGGVYDFRNPATARQIELVCRQIEEATGEQVVLIIVDTLSRALAGGDENSPKDMGAVVAASAYLQEKTKAHVLWVHHIPHDGERMRGHGALLGAVDTTLAVTSAGHQRSARVVKANDSAEGESVAFTIESVEIGNDGTTAPVAVPVIDSPPLAGRDRGPSLTKNQQTLFAMLHEAGSAGLLLEDWNAQAREAGIGQKRKADLNDIRAALKAKGLIRQFGDRWVVSHE